MNAPTTTVAEIDLYAQAATVERMAAPLRARRAADPDDHDARTRLARVTRIGDKVAQRNG